MSDFYIPLEDIRFLAKEGKMTFEEAKKILTPKVKFEEYSTFPHYPKEVCKIISEDRNGNTHVRIQSIKY